MLKHSPLRPRIMSTLRIADDIGVMLLVLDAYCQASVCGCI
jgi:hypothetical protein